jgi:predicted NBD/HSP70 family sugar kinase
VGTTPALGAARRVTAATPREGPDLAEVDVLQIVARAQEGDLRASTATARYLGLRLSTIVNDLDPSCVYIGGEITPAWRLIEPAVRAGLAERMLLAAPGQHRLPRGPDKRAPTPARSRHLGGRAGLRERGSAVKSGSRTDVEVTMLNREPHQRVVARL